MGAADPDPNQSDDPRRQSRGNQPPQQPGAGYGSQRGGPSSDGIFASEVMRQYLIGLLGTLVILSVALFLMVALLGSVGGNEFPPDQDLSGEQESQLQDLYQFSIAQTALGLLPYIGITIVVVFGLLVGTRLTEPRTEKLKLGAASGFLGVSIFVFVGFMLISTQIPDLSNLGGTRGTILSDSVDTGQLLINSLVFGLAGCLAASGATYFGDRVD